MRIIASTIALVLFAAPAAAQSLTDTTGVNGLIGAAPAPAAFVTAVAQSDMFEIQSSQLATKQGTAAVKPFATQMIADHEQSTAKIKSLIQDGAVQASLPPKMSATEQSLLDRLKTLHGGAFDKQYGDDQFNAHNTAVDLFQRYTADGKNKDLQTFAAQMLPVLQHHLEMAKTLPRLAGK